MTNTYVRWVQRLAGVCLVSAACAGEGSAASSGEATAAADGGARVEASTDAGAKPPGAGVPGASATAAPGSAGAASASEDPAAGTAGTSAPPTAGAGPDTGRGSAGAAGNAVKAAAGAPATATEPAREDSDGCPLTLEGFASVSAADVPGTTGGAAGETVTVTTQEELTRYAEAEEPYVIRVQGALRIAPKGTELRPKSNKTIIGVGATAEIVEGGFMLGQGVHNVIIRNLTIHGSFVEDDWEGKTQDFDGVQMDTAHHVWIDHCHFHHMGDGILDSRKDTTNLTVSWNIISDHNKAFGIGWTDNVTAEITIHHNWLRDTNQRNPSTDNVLRAHLYNNWLQRVASYGNYARGGTNMVLEHSVFEDVKDPHYYETGSLVAIGNAYTDTRGKQDSSGASYDFFDPHTLYAYTLTPVADVTSLLTKCAGPRPTLGE